MRAEKEEIIVDGFSFSSKKTADQAKREEQGIRYIREKSDIKNPDMALQIYNKLLNERLFDTPVGFVFLKELQEYLKAAPYISKDAIRAIPFKEPEMSEKDSALLRRQQEKEIRQKVEREKKKEQKVKKSVMQGRFKASLFANVFLVLIIIAMFAITLTSNSVTILNYETEIINKYESWEQDLQEREQAVQAYEEKYGLSD